MNLPAQAFWVSAVVWLGFLDKAFLHTFLYRPICIGPLVGLVFGEPGIGLAVGVATEMMFFSSVFVGTQTPPDEVTSSALAAAFACVTGSVPFGVLLALPVGMLGQRLKQVRNSTAFEYTQKRLETSAQKASAGGILLWTSLVPSLIEYAFFGLPSLLLVWLGAGPAQRLAGLLPEAALSGIALGTGLLGAVGLGLLLGTVKNERVWFYFSAGFLAAVSGAGLAGGAAAAAVCLALDRRAQPPVSGGSGAEAEQSAALPEEKTLSRWDLWKTLIYSLGIESGCSTSKQEAPGFTQAMIPVVEKVYRSKEEKAAAYTRHTQLFLTEGRVAQFIVGVSAAMEERYALRRDIDPSSIHLYKTALMGPLAGIGDSLLHGALRPLMAGIACSLALAGVGSFLGPLLFFSVMTTAVLLARYYGIFWGYHRGLPFLAKLQQGGALDRLTRQAGVVSAVLYGTFASTLLRFGPLSGVAPLLYTLLMYYLVNRKKVSPILLMCMTLLLGVAASFAGILS